MTHSIFYNDTNTTLPISLVLATRVPRKPEPRKFAELFYLEYVLVRLVSRSPEGMGLRLSKLSTDTL